MYFIMAGAICWLFCLSIVYHKTSNIRARCRQWNCWSRCIWSIVCRRCSNCIFIFDLTPGVNRLGKHNFKSRRVTFKLWDLVDLYYRFNGSFLHRFIVYSQPESIESPATYKKWTCLTVGGTIICWLKSVHILLAIQHLNQLHKLMHLSL